MFKSMMIQEYDDYSDAYILVSSRIIMDAERADDAAKRTDKSDRKKYLKFLEHLMNASGKKQCHSRWYSRNW